ncbi:MAG TPA: hypothetical protein VNR90_13385, partial [Vicinamibacterales bacterium]|nr:hypothetical protein [Vicinamibacterales bacterium]
MPDADGAGADAPAGAGAGAGADAVEGAVVEPAAGAGAAACARAEAFPPATVNPAVTMSMRQRDMGPHGAKVVPPVTHEPSRMQDRPAAQGGKRSIQKQKRSRSILDHHLEALAQPGRRNRIDPGD